MAETLRRVLEPGRAAEPGEENAAEAEPPLLLLGGPGSGKTALLFAAALEAAGDGRGPVFFLTRRPLQSLPYRTRAALDPLRLQVTGRRDGIRASPASRGTDPGLSDRYTDQWRARRKGEPKQPLGGAVRMSGGRDMRLKIE